MRNWSRILIVLLVTAALFGCGGDKKPATPKETFMTYIKAIKAKDKTEKNAKRASGLGPRTKNAGACCCSILLYKWRAISVSCCRSRYF